MNNTTNAGRHSAGAPTGRPGKVRSGQGARASSGSTPRTGYNPQSASRPAMRPAAPILTDQARTSNDAQRKIMRPPMPFADAQQGSLQKVPTQKDFRSTGNPKELNYEIS